MEPIVRFLSIFAIGLVVWGLVSAFKKKSKTELKQKKQGEPF